jgi:hypothetical protein
MLGASHLIDCFVEMFGDMEAVVTLWGRYAFEKSLGTGSFPAFGDFQHP